MKSNQLNRVLSLIKKTHDRVVVLDQESDDVVVLMRLPEYEQLLDIGASHEIPLIGNDEEGGLENFSQEDDFDFSPPDNEPVSRPQSPAQPATASKFIPRVGEDTSPLTFNDNWAGGKTEAAPEESLAEVPHEEEQDPPFYLEPVE